MELKKENVVEKCKGCAGVDAQNFCVSYAFPEAKWEHTPGGHCPRATNIVREVSKETKVRNALKESKMKAQGRA